MREGNFWNWGGRRWFGCARDVFGVVGGFLVWFSGVLECGALVKGEQPRSFLGCPRAGFGVFGVI